MNKKRILVIVIICALFIVCYLMINTKYDRLARYPFGTDKERTIIERELNDQEIEYIVEYAIEPDYFMKYINYDKFNIFHVEQYNHFIALFPQFSVEDSIRIVERLCLLNKANDEFYNSLINKGIEYSISILRSYL